MQQLLLRQNAPLESLCSFNKLSLIRAANNIESQDVMNPVLTTTTVEEFEEEGLDLVE